MGQKEISQGLARGAEVEPGFVGPPAGSDMIGRRRMEKEVV